MHNHIRQMLSFGLMVGLVSTSTRADEELTYSDLVHRLVDLEYIATAPAEGETCQQWSSYDRSSRYDADQGAYLYWAANADGDGFIRSENGGKVLAEMKGPGCIWRIWQASTGPGHFKVYLDGSDTPAIDIASRALFDRSAEPFTEPELVYESARGKNCYVPIPYQHSCKIVAHGNWGKYYHFTYTTFPKGTKLPTFSLPLASADRKALRHVNDILAERGTGAVARGADIKAVRETIVIPPGQTVSVADLHGARAIRSIHADPISLGTDARRAMRGLVLSIHWDNEESPSVLAPLRDFFGIAPVSNDNDLLSATYESFPMGTTSEGYYSRFFMPFTQRARLRLTNEGDEECTVRFIVRHEPLKAGPDDYLRFHARWHQGLGENPGREIDWTFLRTKGTGRFVGLALNVWNPMGGWWGEGDEKFFIDGEKYPSTFGTGTEDYFGYAWCSESQFQQAFHGQPISVDQNACAHPSREASGGYISNHRWQIADNVPFHESFEGSVEKYFRDDRPTRYDCTVYWYQRPTASWPRPFPTMEQRSFVQEERIESVLNFLEKARRYDGSASIAELREAYDHIIRESSLEEFADEATAAMALAEIEAGHVNKARRLMQPIKTLLTEPFVLRDHAEAVWRVFGMPETEEGAVRPLLVDNGDGATRRVKREDRWAIMTNRGLGRQYIYFDIPEAAQMKNVDQTVVIEIDYYTDGSPGRTFHLEYDSFLGTGVPQLYHPSRSIDESDQAGWHTVRLECRRARFAGRQNAASDLRVARTGSGELLVGDLRVSLLDQTNATD